MRAILILALLIVATSAKPKWRWVDDPVEKPGPSIREDIAHMTSDERIREYEQMDDDQLVLAIDADLNMAPTIRRDRPAGPPVDPDETGMLDLDSFAPPPPVVDSTGMLDITNDAPSMDEAKCGKGGWTFHNGQCFLTRAKQAGATKGHRETMLQAENYCQINHMAHLPIVMDNKQQKAIIAFGSIHPELKDETPWLALSEPSREGLWIWANGQHVSKAGAKWKAGFPTNDDAKDCAVATTKGWTDVNCESKNLVICQKDPVDSDDTFKHCLDGWEYSQTNENEILGACYWIANKEATWKEANDDCHSKNADLISITTDEEFDFAGRITRWPYFWIGLTNQPEFKEPLQNWVWTGGHTPHFDGFKELHRNRLQNKVVMPIPAPGPHPPPVVSMFATSAWCKKAENKDYCDKSNTRWKIGNRWDDWQQYCLRTPECKNRTPEKLAPAESSLCVVFDTKKKVWKKRDCNAKAAINYACKTDAWKELRPVDPSRNMPNHFTQFSDKIGTCNTPDRMLIGAHQTCLRNWYELTMGGASVAKLATQCPNFCDPITNTTGDGSCVWNIACIRCDQLVKLCTSNKFTVAVCERYIAKNAKKSDFNRCPQFNLCYPAKGVMKDIQNQCLSVYAEWENQYKVLKYDINHITYPCDEICAKMDIDCAWQILCKKCQLLMSLSHTGRKKMYRTQFKYVMERKNEERCQQYTGDVMPAWWVTGNWI